MTNLLLRVNKSSVDSPYASAPGNYVTLDAGDSLIFSGGSATVIDGAVIPDLNELNKAATLLSPLSATIVAHYFLADSSTGFLDEIHLAGNLDKRYVFCASFDGPTASEPQLEAWDDISLASFVLGCLGAGVPASSWYRAKCTTDLTPGNAWPGTPLAGNGVGNSVLLNAGNGVLTVAKDLYFNFHVNIPAAYGTPNQYLPVLVITYTTN